MAHFLQTVDLVEEEIYVIFVNVLQSLEVVLSFFVKLELQGVHPKVIKGELVIFVVLRISQYFGLFPPSSCYNNHKSRRNPRRIDILRFLF